MQKKLISGKWGDMRAGIPPDRTFFVTNERKYLLGVMAFFVLYLWVIMLGVVVRCTRRVEEFNYNIVLFDCFPTIGNRTLSVRFVVFLFARNSGGAVQCIPVELEIIDQIYCHFFKHQIAIANISKHHGIYLLNIFNKDEN